MPDEPVRAEQLKALAEALRDPRSRRADIDGFKQIVDDHLQHPNQPRAERVLTDYEKAGRVALHGVEADREKAQRVLDGMMSGKPYDRAKFENWYADCRERERQAGLEQTRWEIETAHAQGMTTQEAWLDQERFNER